MLRYIIISIVLTIVISSAVCNEKRMKIAILDFSYNESKIDKGIANDIVELFISAFVNTGTFEVIERSRLHQFMKELSLQSSDDFNDAVRQELGKLYGIETVILGNITKFGDSYTINIRGVKISSGVGIFEDTLIVDYEENIPSKILMFVYELAIVKCIKELIDNSNNKSPFFRSVQDPFKSTKIYSLFNNYIAFLRMKKVGTGLFISGTVAMGLGTPAMIIGGYLYIPLIIGTCFFGIGFILFTIGLPLMIIGIKKVNLIKRKKLSFRFDNRDMKIESSLAIKF